MNESNSKFDTDEDIASTWINWIICFSFGIEALSIGYNLSIGPIFLLDKFKKQTSIIVIMFALGAASVTVDTVSVACTNVGKSLCSRRLLHLHLIIVLSCLVLAVAYLLLPFQVSLHTLPELSF